MKNYEEMVDNVFRRSREILAKRTKRRETISKVLCPMGCLCLVALLGFGIWKSDLLNQTQIPLIGDNSGIGENNTPIGNAESITNHSDDNFNNIGVLPNKSNLSELQENTHSEPSGINESQTSTSPGDYNVHAVYHTIPATYEEVKSLFGHPIIQCSSNEFLGYALGTITPNGNINDNNTSYLSVIYSFRNGEIELIDQSRLGAGASISYEFYPTEEYKGCTFWHDSTSNSIYFPLSDNLLMTGNFSHMDSPEIYELLLTLGGKI